MDPRHPRRPDRGRGRRHGGLRLVPRQSDPPLQRQGAGRRPLGRGRRRHRKHPPGRLHRPVRPDGPERRLRSVLAGRQRGQFRRGDDPAPRSAAAQPVHPVDPTRPVRAQRPGRGGQQDRRRPLRGAQPARGRHQRGPRDPHPALRRAQLRHVRQRGRRPRRSQDVLPRTGVRRLLGTAGVHPRLRLPRRGPRPPGRAGAAPAVQAARGHHHRSELLAVREPE